MPFSPYSNIATATTQATGDLPVAPTSLAATAVSQSQIDLTWQDNSSNEDLFSIERSPNGTSGWVEIATVGANVAAYSNTGLDPETIYFYRVRAKRNPGFYSAFSNTANATTEEVSILWWFESDFIPAQLDNTDLDAWPSQFAVGVDMQFPGTEGGTKPKYFINIFSTLPAVRIAAGNQGDIPYPNISPILTGKSCTFYHVLNYNAQQSGAAALLQNFLSGQAAAISLYGSGDLADTGNNQNNQVGFEVAKNTVPNTVDKDLVNGTSGRQLLVFTFNVSTGFATLHWNGQLVSTIAMPAIPAGGFAFGQSFIEFFALNGGSDACVGDHGAALGFVGAHSDVTRAGYEATLIAKYGIVDTTFVNAPSSLVATPVGSTQLDLTWMDNADNEDGFSLERSPDGTSGWTEVAAPAANATSYSDTGLTASTQYFYRLRAQTGPIPIYSEYSSVANATTGAFDPYTLPNQLWMFESDAITPQSDNTALTNWPDSSPYADGIGFSTGAKYRTNHFGTLPAVQTLASNDGTKAGVTGATFPTTSFTQYFIVDYQVADQTDTISGGVLVADIAVGGNHSVTPVVGSDFNGTDQVSFIEDDSFTVHDFGADTNGKKLLTFKWDKAAGTCKLYRNGTLVNTISGLGTSGWYVDTKSLYFLNVQAF